MCQRLPFFAIACRAIGNNAPNPHPNNEVTLSSLSKPHQESVVTYRYLNIGLFPYTSLHFFPNRKALQNYFQSKFHLLPSQVHQQLTLLHVNTLYRPLCCRLAPCSLRVKNILSAQRFSLLLYPLYSSCSSILLIDPLNE